MFEFEISFRLRKNMAKQFALIPALLLLVACVSCSGSSAPPPQVEEEQSATAAAPVFAPSFAPASGAPHPAPAVPVGNRPSVGAAPQPIARSTGARASDPPVLDFEQILTLPGEAKRLAVAGDGRYLVIVAGSKGKVVLVDLKERKLRDLAEVGHGEVLVAGGATRCVVVDTVAKTVARYLLETGAQELQTPLTGLLGRKEVKVVAAGMGQASEGPLWVVCKNERRFEGSEGPIQLLTLDTFASRPIWQAGQFGLSSGGGLYPLYVAADGRRAAAAGHRQCDFFELFDDTVKHHDRDGERLSVDGRFLLSPGMRIDLDGDRIEVGGRESNLPLSSCNLSDLWFSVDDLKVITNHTIDVKFYYGTDPTPIAGLPIRGTATTKMNSLAAFDRFHYQPGEKTIAFIGPGPSTVASAPAPDVAAQPAEETSIVAFKTFDIATEAKRNGAPVALVTSKRPAEFVPGKPFSYQYQTSGTAKPTYRLDVGPEGMTVSPAGLVEWSPAAEISSSQDAVITIEQAGVPSRYDVLRLRRGNGEPAVAATPSAAGEIRTSVGAVMSTFKFPAPVDEVIAGGGGMYLLARCNQGKVVAVIDVLKRSVVKVIESADESLIAAGATKFVVQSTKTGQIARWSFETLTVETTVKQKPFDAMAMGSASEGPILSYRSEAAKDEILEVVDLRSLKSEALDAGNSRNTNEPPPRMRLVACSTGKHFGGWIDGDRGTYDSIFLDAPMMYRFGDRDLSVGVTSFDGTTLYGPRQIHKHIGLSYDGATYEGRRMIPAEDGPFLLQFHSSGEHTDGRNILAVRAQGGNAPIAKLPEIPLPYIDDGNGDDISRMRRRMFFLTKGEAIVIPGADLTQLHLYHFSLERTLQESARSGLRVVSIPKMMIVAGKTLTYQIEARSKSEGIRFKLLKGPENLKLSPTGLINWATEARRSDSFSIDVEVSDDSGAKLFYTFPMFAVERNR